MPTTEPIVPEPRRFSIPLPRPLWIGLAAFVLVVVAIAWQFGLPMYRQRVAIQEIESQHGTVTSRPGGPKWLRARLGDERMRIFDDVVVVDLAGRDPSSAALRHIDWLTGLETLHLDSAQLTDAGMINLKRLTRLQVLSLSGTQVRGAGLANLERM